VEGQNFRRIMNRAVHTPICIYSCGRYKRRFRRLFW